MLVWKCLHDAAPRYLALLRMSPGPGTDYTNGPPITRTVARFVQAPAQDPLVCSSTRQCWLQLWVSCTVVRRCCDCTTSSAPTTNLQTRLDSTNTSLTVRLSFSQRLWVNPGLAKSVRPWLLRSPAERFGLRILFFCRSR